MIKFMIIRVLAVILFMYLLHIAISVDTNATNLPIKVEIGLYFIGAVIFISTLCYKYIIDEILNS